MPETLENKMAALEQYDLMPESGTPMRDEPKKAEKPAAAEPEPEEKPVHPNWLLAAARKLGFHASEIEGMTSADLKSAVATVAQTQAAMRSEQDNERAGRQQPKAPEPEPETDTLAELGIDPTKWNEDTPTAEIFRAVTKPLIKRIKQLEAENQGRSQREQARETYSRLDKLFNSRPDWYGQGAQDEIDEESHFMIRRQAAVQAMRSKVNRGMAIKQAFDEVTEAMAPAPAKPTNDDPKGLRNGASLKPSARTTAQPPKGVKAAEEAVAAKKREIEERNAHLGAEEDDLPE